MRSEHERESHRRFVQALQHEHLTCANCSIRWADPSTGTVYYFGNEQVLVKRL